MTETTTATESSGTSKQEQGPPDHLNKHELKAGDKEPKLSKNELRNSGVGKPSWGQQNKEPLETRGEDSTRPYAPFDDLVASYAEWINYDPAQDAAEAAEAQKINTIFDPVNAARNQHTEDWYEANQASGAALAKTQAENWGASNGYSGQAIINNTQARLADAIEFREKGSPWDPYADNPGLSGGLKGDLKPSGFSGTSKGLEIASFDDSEVQSKLWNMKDPGDVTAIQNAPVKGFATFQDDTKQTVSVPQLGWGRTKPNVFKWTMEETETWWVRVDGSASKQVSGSKGQNVWNNGGNGLGSALGSMVNGGKHMMGREGSAEATGWDHFILTYKVNPDGTRTEAKAPKSLLNQREAQLKKLKAYYVERRKFIDDYSSYLPE